MKDVLLKNFYTTPRRSLFLSDHGGPFGFDIHFALEVDYCITQYDCDCIFETGTNGGDTTEFLAKQYPDKQIISCEVNKDFFRFAKERLSRYKNVLLLNQSSDEVIKEHSEKYNLPFFYLDAHFYHMFPLKSELQNMHRGVVCVGDFYVNDMILNEIGRLPVPYGHEFDENENPLNSDMILEFIKPSTEIYVNNMESPHYYEFPSLQSIRRCGRAYFCKDVSEDKFVHKDYFILLKEFQENQNEKNLIK